MSEIADSKRGRPRLLLVGKVLLLIVVIALAGFGLSRTKNEQRPVDPFTVQRGDLDVALVAGSTAMSLAPQHIQVEVSSDEGIQVLKLLEEGHLITKEDIANRLVLAEFDSARIEQRIMDYELYYESAVSAFADAEQFLEVMGRINDSLLRSAERKVRFAAMDLRKYLGEALADEIIGKVNRQFAAESALEGLRQAVADEVAAQEKAKQAAQAAADARASGTEEPLPATESALAVPAEVLSEPAPFAVQEGKRGDRSSSTEAESLGARYGFAEDVRTPEELEAEAAIAAEAAEAASRLVEQARGEFESALQAVGLDTNAFTGDVHEWTIEFDPVDFHALGQDPRLGGAAALEREKLRTDIMLDRRPS